MSEIQGNATAGRGQDCTARQHGKNLIRSNPLPYHCCRGQVRLLRRTAHQAVLYAKEPDSILLHAGYALHGDEGSEHGDWLSDLVVLNTARRGLLGLEVVVKCKEGLEARGLAL